MSARLDIAAVAAALAENMADLARELCGEPTSRRGDDWRFRGKGSLAVQVAGPRRGRWRDFEAGVGGDAIDFVSHRLGLSKREAWEWGLDRLGYGRSSGARPTTARTAPAPLRKALEP